MPDRKPIPELSDEQEAQIQAGIAADPDNPEWTEDDFKNARPFAEVFPEWAKAIDEGRMGGFATVNVDLKIVRKLDAQGKELQDRVNDILRKAVGL
jgi:uncharacterized protein (DUF4415 family)